MEPTYIRLLEAATELKQWKGPAEMARGITKAGYELSEQTVSNWRTRGVFIEAIVHCARIIGARVEYIRAGELPIQDYRIPHKIGKLALRAAFILDRLPEEEQLKLLHFLQVRADGQSSPESATRQAQ